MVNSKQKGLRLQREVADVFQEYGHDARSSGHAQAGSDVHEEPDVVLGDVWWEVKGGKAPPIMAALRQARDEMEQSPNRDDYTMPAVLSKKDRGRWLVTFDLREFLERTQSPRSDGTA